MKCFSIFHPAPNANCTVHQAVQDPYFQTTHKGWSKESFHAEYYDPAHSFSTGKSILTVFKKNAKMNATLESRGKLRRNLLVMYKE